jgi:hypothetical protein
MKHFRSWRQPSDVHPKVFGVIRLDQVTEFVQQDVSHVLGLKKQELAVQTDSAGA